MPESGNGNDEQAQKIAHHYGGMQFLRIILEGSSLRLDERKQWARSGLDELIPAYEAAVPESMREEDYRLASPGRLLPHSDPKELIALCESVLEEPEDLFESSESEPFSISRLRAYGDQDRLLKKAIAESTEIPNHLEHVREKYGLKKPNMASLMMVSTRTYERWVGGGDKPGAGTITLLANRLKVSPIDLVQGRV